MNLESLRVLASEATRETRPAEVATASFAVMEAIILAGGKAERLGEAAGGRPKALVEIAGRPLVAYQVEQLAAAGVERVLVSCAKGHEELFEAVLGGVGEPEPLGRGGGIRYAAAARHEAGDVYALNGDELVDVDLEQLLRLHSTRGAAATITVVPLRSPFGVVELEGDLVTGFREAPRLEHWVSCGVYVLGDDALARLPERGDHETTTFPALAAAGRLRAHRHEGLWLTVNTPKDLRVAEEHFSANPGWPVAAAR
jgi:NDP-sugar pyrophosphorylase family protein